MHTALSSVLYPPRGWFRADLCPWFWVCLCASSARLSMSHNAHDSERTEHSEQRITRTYARRPVVDSLPFGAKFVLLHCVIGGLSRVHLVLTQPHVSTRVLCTAACHACPVSACESTHADEGICPLKYCICSAQVSLTCVAHRLWNTSQPLSTCDRTMALQNASRQGVVQALRAFSSSASQMGVLAHVEPAPKVCTSVLDPAAGTEQYPSQPSAVLELVTAACRILFWVSLRTSSLIRPTTR